MAKAAVVALVLVGVSLAAAWEAKPKPCCTPDQWEGGVGSIGGVVMRRRPIGVQRYVKLSYDYKNKLLAMNEYVSFGRIKRNDKVILNFKKKAMYIIIKEKCYKKELKKSMTKMCAPVNSTYMGSFTFGLKPNSLQVDNWGYTVMSRRPPVSGNFSIGFTLAKGCIPVGENVQGVKYTRRGPVFVSMATGFVNITGGIKDPKVFTPPKMCGSYQEEFQAADDMVDLKFHGFSDTMRDLYQRFVELF